MPTNIHFTGGGHVRVDMDAKEAAGQFNPNGGAAWVEFSTPNGRTVMLNPSQVTHIEDRPVGVATF